MDTAVCLALWENHTDLHFDRWKSVFSETHRSSWKKLHWKDSLGSGPVYRRELLSLECQINCFLSLLKYCTVRAWWGSAPNYPFLTGKERQGGSECDVSTWGGTRLSRQWVCPCGFSTCRCCLSLPFLSVCHALILLHRDKYTPFWQKLT